MKKLYILISVIFICSCGMSVKNDENFGHFQMAEISIPNARLEELVNKELVSKEEIEGIIEKYKKTDEPDYLAASLDLFLCGGVWFEGHDDLGDAMLFKLVGVTEKWIPIDGKPIKFLHFKLVE